MTIETPFDDEVARRSTSIYGHTSPGEKAALEHEEGKQIGYRRGVTDEKARQEARYKPLVEAVERFTTSMTVREASASVLTYDLRWCLAALKKVTP